jgi:hypothetical protein
MHIILISNRITRQCSPIQSLPRVSQGTPEFRAATVPFEPFEGQVCDGIPDKQSRPFSISQRLYKAKSHPQIVSLRDNDNRQHRAIDMGSIN